MTQNRPPPAYMEYAAAMLANVQYRTMNLAERGLLDTMRRECWVNHSLPDSPSILARVLGFNQQQIEDTLPCVMPFFLVVDSKIICPELEDYRAHLTAIREKQSEGGKRGAGITNSAKPKPRTRINKGSTGNTASNSQVDMQVKSESLVQPSSIQTNQTQSLGGGDIHAPWVNGYTDVENEQASSYKDVRG